MSSDTNSATSSAWALLSKYTLIILLHQATVNGFEHAINILFLIESSGSVLHIIEHVTKFQIVLDVAINRGDGLTGEDDSRFPSDK